MNDFSQIYDYNLIGHFEGRRDQHALTAAASCLVVGTVRVHSCARERDIPLRLWQAERGPGDQAGQEGAEPPELCGQVWRAFE